MNANNDNIKRSARYDMIAGLALVGLAIFLLIASFDIPVEFGDSGIGPRSFPQAICGLIILIGMVLVVQGARGRIAPGDESSLEIMTFIKVVLPLVLLSFVYVLLFKLFGYVSSTLVILYAACFHFGVRGKALLILPLVVSAAFYYLFFGLMGVFEPPATLFNFIDLFR